MMKWQHISYSDGSNPYICFTEKEFKRLKRKYGKAMTKLRDGFWYVKVPKPIDYWGMECGA